MNSAAIIKPLWKAKLGQAVAFSRDSKLLAVGGARGPVRLLDAQTGELRIVCEGPKANIYRIAFSPDGNELAIGPIYKQLAICNAMTGKLVTDLRMGHLEIKELAFSSKTGHLIRTDFGAEIGVFKTKPLKPCASIKPASDTHGVHAALFSPDGDTLFVAWKTNSPKQKVTMASFSWPDAKRMAFGSVPVDMVYDASVSNDGQFLALAFSSYDPHRVGAALLDATSCKLVRTVFTDESCCVMFVPSKSLLIMSDTEKDLEICRFVDPKSGKELGRFVIGNNRVFKFALSHDEQLLAAATFRGAMVWDLKRLLSTFGLA